MNNVRGLALIAFCDTKPALRGCTLPPPQHKGFFLRKKKRCDELYIKMLPSQLYFLKTIVSIKIQLLSKHSNTVNKLSTFAGNFESAFDYFSFVGIPELNIHILAILLVNFHSLP